MPTVTVASLVESLHHDMVCRDDSFAAALLPDGYECLGVRAAIERALTRPRAGTRVAERDPMGPCRPTRPGPAARSTSSTARRDAGRVSRLDGLLLGVPRPGWPRLPGVIVTVVPGVDPHPVREKPCSSPHSTALVRLVTPILR